MTMLPELFLGAGAKVAAQTRADELIGNSRADLKVLAPSEGTVIGIDQVREALVWGRYGPAQGQYKVVVIDPAERLSHEAASALLKSLEETPPYLAFILVAQAPDQVLPTILSRCAIIWAGSPLEFLARRLQKAGYTAKETDFLLWLTWEEKDFEPFFRERREPFSEWAEALAEAKNLPPEELATRFSAYISDPIRRRATAWTLARALPSLPVDVALAAADRLSRGGREACLAFLWELVRFLQESSLDLPSQTILSWARKASLARGEVEVNANLRLLMEVILLWPKR